MIVVSFVTVLKENAEIKVNVPFTFESRFTGTNSFYSSVVVLTTRGDNHKVRLSVLSSHNHDFQTTRHQELHPFHPLRKDTSQ